MILKNGIQFIIILVITFYSCHMSTDKASIEKWENEIIEVEQSFAKMLKEEGMEKAFLAYAAEDAVLMRNNSLLTGKEAIRNFINGKTTKKLSWEPDFVEVAASGDLAYTYGKYVFSYLNEEGIEKKDRGIFHTIWKRQKDGSWKFVWD